MPVAADYLVQLFGLEGDVAFITGGGGAIGAATAVAYAKAGATVVLADKAVGAPEDLVGAMLYLASRASSLVTGHTLAVDGGWLAW